jgi:hypothetical protein
MRGVLPSAAVEIDERFVEAELPLDQRWIWRREVRSWIRRLILASFDAHGIASVHYADFGLAVIQSVFSLYPGWNVKDIPPYHPKLTYLQSELYSKHSELRRMTAYVVDLYSAHQYSLVQALYRGYTCRATMCFRNNNVLTLNLNLRHRMCQM